MMRGVSCWRATGASWASVVVVGKKEKSGELARKTREQKKLPLGDGAALLKGNCV